MIATNLIPNVVVPKFQQQNILPHHSDRRSSSHHYDATSSSTLNPDYDHPIPIEAIPQQDYDQPGHIQADFKDEPQSTRPPQLDPNAAMSYHHYLSLRQVITDLHGELEHLDNNSWDFRNDFYNFEEEMFRQFLYLAPTPP